MNDLLSGILLQLPDSVLIPFLALLIVGFGFFGVPLWGWTITATVVLYGCGVSLWVIIPLITVLLLFVVPLVRRNLISRPLLNLMSSMGVLPSISETEQIALESGDVWIEEELFSGNPDFQRIREKGYPSLSDRERAFVEGPVEEVCEMTDDWDIWKNRRIPDECWEFMREKKFFGMIIPEEYGGLGFSPLGTSQVIHKLSTRSSTLAITTMVPNSLGPGELLDLYGTDEQREKYLPKLATGEEIPCFGLTEPKAGSDAGSMTSEGTVFKDDDGELKIRLNWEKRWITLAPIATLIGLAFRLKDPENHLGKGEDVGITTALVPADKEGIDNTKFHDPLGVPFYNGPTRGEDVVIPADQIIGGVDWAGRGWQMLMEALAAGRGMSIPASASGVAKFASRVTSAHGVVRRQFNLPVGKFEGVEEPLARIGGKTYLMEATRRFNCESIKGGRKPTVTSAIAKYNMSELGREVINDGMDIRSGAAITRGPSNLLAHDYIGTPIPITVEGANILTRSMIIFGQGSIRCHPYLLDEMMGMMEEDVTRFDRAFFSHIGHIVQNGFRSMVMSLTRGWASVCNPTNPFNRYYRHLEWASTSFAFLADIALTSLGGALKRKEKISGRFADIFSWMYMATAVLQRFDAEGGPSCDRPFFEWSMEYAFYKMQEAFEGLYRNLEVPGLTSILRYVVLPWSKMNAFGSPPSDKLGHEIAREMQKPGKARQKRTSSVFQPNDEDDPFVRLEEAFHKSYRADQHIDSVKTAMEEGDLEKGNPYSHLEEAVGQEIISEDEKALIEEAKALRDEVVQVDEFPFDKFEEYGSLDV